jgi:hypothetical protein
MEQLSTNPTTSLNFSIPVLTFRVFEKLRGSEILGEILGIAVAEKVVSILTEYLRDNNTNVRTPGSSFIPVLLKRSQGACYACFYDHLHCNQSMM